MSNSAIQIIEQYETLGMTVAQISEVEKMPEIVIKTVLEAHSAKYRADVKANLSADFNETDEQLALETIRRVARNSDDDSVALKAAMFMRNDKKGRLDVKKGIVGLKLNVSVINDHIQKAMEAAASRVLPSPPKQEVIDV
jgi:hypothetical protein